MIGTGDLTHTAKICLLLIVDSTIGFSRRQFAAISLDRFSLIARTSSDYCRSQLAELERLEWIVKRSRPDGTVEYSPASWLWYEANARDPMGECDHCKSITKVFTYTTVPHSIVRKLAMCCSHAAYAVTLVVAAETVRWDKDAKCPYVEAGEITTEDFCAGTGLKEREVQLGIREALRLGIIGCDDRAGRVQRYKVLPKQFSELTPRAPRRINQPEHSKRGDFSKEKANLLLVKKKEDAENTEAHPAIESVRVFHGRCKVCRSFARFTPVLDDVNPPGTDHTPASSRAGPPPDVKPAAKSSQEPERPEEERDWRALNGELVKNALALYKEQRTEENVAHLRRCWNGLPDDDPLCLEVESELYASMGANDTRERGIVSAWLRGELQAQDTTLSFLGKCECCDNIVIVDPIPATQEETDGYRRMQSSANGDGDSEPKADADSDADDTEPPADTEEPAAETLSRDPKREYWDREVAGLSKEQREYYLSLTSGGEDGKALRAAIRRAHGKQQP